MAMAMAMGMAMATMALWQRHLLLLHHPPERPSKGGSKRQAPTVSFQNFMFVFAA